MTKERNPRKSIIDLYEQANVSGVYKDALNFELESDPPEHDPLFVRSKSIPGSAQRIEEMRWRVKNGFPLWHPDDPETLADLDPGGFNEEDNMGIKENIAARELFDEFKEIWVNELLDESVNEGRFYELMAVFCAAQIGRIVEEPKGKMTDEEAQIFENKRVPFGAFEGKTVGDVPNSYWTSTIDSPFNKNIRRYLLSDYVRRKQSNVIVRRT